MPVRPLQAAAWAGIVGLVLAAGLLQLLLGHHRKRDPLDDDRVARDPDDRVLGLDAVSGEQLADGGDHRAGVHEGAVDDGLGRHRSDAEVLQAATPGTIGLKLQELDVAGPDVQCDCISGTGKQGQTSSFERLEAL